MLVKRIFGISWLIVVGIILFLGTLEGFFDFGAGEKDPIFGLIFIALGIINAISAGVCWVLGVSLRKSLLISPLIALLLSVVILFVLFGLKLKYGL